MRRLLHSIHAVVHWVSSELLFGELMAVFVVVTIGLAVVSGLSAAGLSLGVFLSCCIVFGVLDAVLDCLLPPESSLHTEQDA